jgi:hypothetical protein
MFRWLFAWLAASVVTYATGSVLMTQVVLGDVASFGIDVDLAARLRTTAADLAGLAGSYLPLVAVALLVAFLVATALRRLLPVAWRPLCLVAGATSVGALLGIMSAVFGMNPLAGAAGAGGLSLQMLAGLAGGGVFSMLTGPRRG